MNNLPLTIPQSLQILYQAVNIGQSKGAYTLDDSSLIKMALDSLRVRLRLSAQFKPLTEPGLEPVSEPEPELESSESESSDTDAVEQVEA